MDDHDLGGKLLEDHVTVRHSAKNPLLSPKAWSLCLIAVAVIWLLGLMLTGTVRGAFVVAGSVTFFSVVSILIEACSRNNCRK